MFISYLPSDPINRFRVLEQNVLFRKKAFDILGRIANKVTLNNENIFVQDSTFSQGY